MSTRRARMSNEKRLYAAEPRQRQGVEALQRINLVGLNRRHSGDYGDYRPGRRQYKLFAYIAGAVGVPGAFAPRVYRADLGWQTPLASSFRIASFDRAQRFPRHTNAPIAPSRQMVFARIRQIYT